MSEDFGNGVSRTLSALQRQFQNVVFQKGKPPLDSEFNLVSQASGEALRQFVSSQVHSGFFLDPTLALEDFVTDPLNSNQFFLGTQKNDDDGNVEELDPVVFANVNGWIIPITGTIINQQGATTNQVRLNPPPESDNRIDFVFLEAWQVLVSANPSTDNKPSASTIWKYGNTEYGGVNITDDLVDPTIGFPTTRRVQLQYRIRVVGSGNGAGSSPDLSIYPDGLGDPNITAQGPNDSASAFVYENMRKALGDASLWRAGDGDPDNALGTVDGYVYAIPICAVFRRNSLPFVAATLSGNPNQNGAFNRNPSAILLTNPLEGAKKLTHLSLINALPAQQFTVDTVVQVDFGQGSGFDDPSMDLNKTFMVIDNEVIAIKSINTAVNPNQVVVPAGGRGRWGSDIVTHEGRTDPTVAGTGSKINFFNTRPDGKFADEIAQDDILDLRRGINVGDWDYERLLLHNIAMLIRGRLRSTWKQAGVPGGDTEGVDVIEVDYLLQDGATAVPNGTEAVDGPDGIRQVWSDAAAIQGDVTVLCDNDGTISSGFVQTLDDLVEWDVGADFKPSGFINNLGSNGYTNGTTIFLHIGGDDGNQGARKTFRANGTRAVRFVAPKEYFKRILPEADTGLQTPVSLLWTSTDQANAGVQAPGAGLQALIPASVGESQTEHPGPMYPLASQNFEYPYLVTGGVVNNALVVTGINGATQLIGNSLNPTIPLGEGEIVLPGLNFDAAGDWYSLNAQGLFANNPGVLNFPLLRGQRTLFDMITNGGRDRTGNSSELYLILFGDDETTANNGVWKVIGAGTATDASGSGLTTNPASASNRVRVKFMTVDPSAVAAPFIYQDFDNTTTKTLTAQIRSQITNAEDGPGAAVGPASLCVTLTDISAKLGGASNPWSETNINPSSLPGFTLEQPFNEKLVINLTLLYHPGRGATQRVATRMDRVAMQSAPSKVLRQSKAVLDPTFPTATGAPSNPAETQFDPVHVQTWNRLPSLGLPAPQAPNYGGNVVLFSEIDRENEVFFDNGSKTLVLRPVQRQSMTIQGITVTPPTVGATLLGIPTLDNPSAGTTYPNPALIPSGWDGPKDDAQIFTTGLRGGYAVPQQYMPRFGRQDIPYYQDNGPAFGTGQFLEGINHLFLDTTDVTNPVFNIIGGQDNLSGGNLVTRFLLQTGTTSGLDYAQYGTITGTTSQAYQARLTTEIDNCCSGGEEIAEYLANVTSSDFGTGLRGIQLPPYLGIVRLYGVYDRRDFVAKGGVTYQANRVTPEANRATNLLRRDATKQTLFICKDGAIDLTGEADDHTYIIPENVLDLTKSPFYSGEDFSEMEYVVEFTCFGFSKGFINKNNLVMTRRHNGQGALITDGDNPELEGVLMCIPSAAPDSSRVYVSSTRTVYQGDPYFSRAGATRTLSDYETRYGQISQSDAFELSKRIQQFDANGEQIPEIPNARKFQVLAALDFYTTLGSGNIGGRLYPGTPLDVGFTQNTPDAATRIPASVTTPAWRVLTRAFTEGQQKNSSRASAILEIIGTNATFDFVTPSTFSVQTLSGALVQFKAVNGPTLNPDEFDASSPDPTVIARELFEKINERADLSDTLIAFNDIDSTQIELVSRVVGAEGNEIIVSINDEENFLLNVARSGDEGFNSLITSTNLRGGEDILANGGNGTTQLELTGMTERLPLGILLQDSDFIGENPLNDNTSAFQTLLGGIRPSQILLPLTRSGGEEYTRFTGAPGELIAQGDGAILAYGAYNATTNPTGSKRFRLFRGGGSLFVLNGRNPGGPIDWVSDTLEPALKPVLKGGLLACKALLVRNYVENAFSDDAVTTDGDEIQLIIISQGILGDGTTQNRGLDLNGIISPTGFGEGMAASDRYRIAGKPMYQGRVRTAPNPDDILLAVFPGRNAF
jgi:hypothetical protein